MADWDLSELDMTALANAGALDLVAETVAAGASAADARKWWLGELARRANDDGSSSRARDHAGAGGPGVRARRRGPLNDRLAREVIDGVLAARARPTRSSRRAAWPWSATTAP